MVIIDSKKITDNREKKEGNCVQRRKATDVRFAIKARNFLCNFSRVVSTTLPPSPCVLIRLLSSSSLLAFFLPF